jgi:putative transposase
MAAFAKNWRPCLKKKSRVAVAGRHDCGTSSHKHWKNLGTIQIRVRQSGRIVSVAVIVAVGVNSDGRREVLGMDIGPSEAEPFCTEFLRKLARRGLRGIKLVVSDAHEGIKAAVAKVLHASWQRCRVHFMRNVLAHAGRQGRRVVSVLSSAPLSCRMTLRPRVCSGAKSPTSFVPKCQSSPRSWMKQRPTCSPS